MSANQRRPTAHLDTSALAAAKVLPISVVRMRADIGHLSFEELRRGDQMAGPLCIGRLLVVGEGLDGALDQRVELLGA